MTTQPFDGPPQAEEAAKGHRASQQRGDAWLFSTDFPHDHGRDVSQWPENLPQDLVQRWSRTMSGKPINAWRSAHERDDPRTRTPGHGQDRHRGLRHSTRPFPRPRNCRAICRNAGASMRLISAIRTPNAFLGRHALPPHSRPATAWRRDSWPPNGGPPASDLAFLQEQLLDPLGIEFGILQPLAAGSCGLSTRNSASRSAPRSMTGRSTNGSTRSPRLKGSICVTNEDTDSAIAEIEARVADKRFVADLGAAARTRAGRAQALPGRSTRRPPITACRSACIRRPSAAGPTPAAAGRPSTSRNTSPSPTPARPC